MRKAWFLLGLMLLIHGTASGKGYPFPEEAGKGQSEPMLSQFSLPFYPIGYSQDRYFAYAVYRDFADGVGEMSELTVTVQDLATDEKVAVWVNPDPLDGSMRSFSELWQDYQAEISALLNRYHIRPLSIEIIGLPYNYGAHSLDVRMDLVPLADKEIITRSYSAVTVTVRRDDGKQKIIYNNSDPDFTHLEELGVICFPGSSRLAIILAAHVHVFEDSVEIYPLIIGCHLEKGFK